MESRSNRKRNRGRREKDSRVSTYLLMFGCIAMLAAGFFLAAQQHFSSMDYGMKNSRLRKQVEQLESEKRRLILAKEVSLSPMEIKKAAKRAGMLDSPILDTRDASLIVPTMAKATSDEKPLVMKTASTAPVSAAKPRADSSQAKASE